MTDENAKEAQEELSLTDQLDAAWKELETEDPAEETSEDPPEEAPKEEAPDTVEPPEHWSDTDKEAFNSLPEEARPLYLEKAKSIESGYNAKFEDLANERKTLEAVKGFAELFTDQHREQLRQMGTTPEGYVRSLIATHAQLQQNPRETLTNLARQLNVSLGEAEALEEDLDPADKKLKDIESQVQNLSNVVTNSQRSQETASQQQITETWQAFAAAKDEQGNELYPKAEALKVKMGLELQTLESIPGETAKDLLERAYDSVKWTDPTLRASILEAEAKAKHDKAEAERKDKVAKAKKAGRDVKGKSEPVSEAPKPNGSLRSELESAWDSLSQ